jgi:nitroreductase
MMKHSTRIINRPVLKSSVRSFSTTLHSFQQSTASSHVAATHFPTIEQSSDKHFSQHSKILEETVLARYAAKQFIPDKQIPPQVLSHIIALSQRVPGGYNLQPWVAIVVNDEAKKRDLYEVALRQEKILQAPCTVVFAANHGRPLENLDTMLEMDRQFGTLSEEKIDRVRRLATALLDAGPLCIKQVAKFLFTYALSLFVKPMMIAPINMKAYVWKQTMLSVQTLLLAASSHGVQTCAIEGFDERRIKQVVGLPSHYSVPVIVAMGYSNEHLEGDMKRSIRIQPERQFYKDDFGRKLDNLMSFNTDFPDFLEEFKKVHGDVFSDPLPIAAGETEVVGTLPIIDEMTMLPTQKEIPMLPVKDDVILLDGDTSPDLLLPPPSR